MPHDRHPLHHQPTHPTSLDTGQFDSHFSPVTTFQFHAAATPTSPRASAVLLRLGSAIFLSLAAPVVVAFVWSSSRSSGSTATDTDNALPTFPNTLRPVFGRNGSAEPIWNTDVITPGGRRHARRILKPTPATPTPKRCRYDVVDSDDNIGNTRWKWRRPHLYFTRPCNHPIALEDCQH
ncbi:hypothetical protein H257_17238 [Aphanomyces astaci]|uniref:Uncharacterized protein n=1 Tax=Aphanomyces astaci TaxID=112090 RepID=W4FHD1_APHAT|nr:hypothetical protein H257_17238 [Aphanomyces astaci]ETV66269.1 hypothetical protein H257_17238 [Aphanomyces astaci]|eukprot:XP_009844256.1 hypothetical protein H257_17238 [Aphanomyces astaci]